MDKISKTALNKIGNVVRQQKNDAEYLDAINVLNSWREEHGAILDKYYDKCVELAGIYGTGNIVVAQRLKRLPTIIGKLNRFPNMSLSRMQDIAGVRIICEDMEQLGAIRSEIEGWDGLIRIKDYIIRPKESGYRGVHFVFEEDGRLVEVQLRTQMQHLWASSLETVDVFRGTTLKEKDDDSYWHDFFCQVSSIFASAEESPVLEVHTGLNALEICSLLDDNINKHSIKSTILGYALSDPIIKKNGALKDAYYLVIMLDSLSSRGFVQGFKENEYHSAFEEYKKKEKERGDGENVVLVAVSQINKIREIYPNYFLNLNNFLGTIEFMLASFEK